MTGEPYPSDELIALPVPPGEAADLASSIYQRPADRPVVELELGGVSFGHFRMVSITTGRTPGGQPQIVATYQRVYL